MAYVEMTIHAQDTCYFHFESIPDNLIAYGATPEMSDITLSSHKGNPNEAVQLKVKILSIYDSHTEVDLSVLVRKTINSFESDTYAILSF